MLIVSDRSNLLEKEPYEYSLQHVEEPNLFREIFPYSQVPKIPFNHRVVAMDMPKDIWITDTTFRDGQQSRPPYTARQIVDLYDMIHRLGGDNGVIRQSEFFVYSEKDRNALFLCKEKGYKFPEITTWIRANAKDFELIKDLEISETGILVSCSDYHIFKKLRMNRQQALEHYLAIVKSALEIGIRPRCHFEDITRADFYGFVIPFVNELVKLSSESRIPIKFRMCDTLGFGIPYTGVALPRSVPGIISGLRHFTNIPSELIEWHGHNDFYKGVINATVAWLYGASAVNCSLLGIGERTGNVPLEAMIFEYASLKGTMNGMQPEVITEIASYFEKELNYEIPSNTPFVGSNFNKTSAGIHADGVVKDEEIYNIFDTNILLRRPIGVSINNVSGVASIVYWLNSKYNSNVDKNSKVVQYVKKWVDLQYDDGRQTMISDSELEKLVEQYTIENNLGRGDLLG